MYLPIKDFRLHPATHIVGLGPTCATAYNCRRFFDFGGAYPFDWWVTKGTSLIRFLQSLDVDGLYEPSNLSLTLNGTSVVAKNLDILLHHEFPRRWKEDGHPISGDFLDHVERPKLRTSALLKKFLSLNSSGNRVLFVQKATERQYEKNLELEKVLGNLFRVCDWTYTTVGGQVALDKGPDWKGDIDGWNSELAELNIRLDRTSHKPFSGQKLMD